MRYPTGELFGFRQTDIELITDLFYCLGNFHRVTPLIFHHGTGDFHQLDDLAHEDALLAGAHGVRKDAFRCQLGNLGVLVLQLIVGGDQRLGHQLGTGKGRALCQLLLHLVEGGNVLQLPLYGLLAGKAHRQQRKAVPVHEVHGVLLAPILEAGKMEHRFGSRIFGHQILYCIQNMFVLLAEALSDLAAGYHRLAILGG